VRLILLLFVACSSALPNAADPTADRDHDGIPDRCDCCPDKPEVYQGMDDEDGCPDACHLYIGGEPPEPTITPGPCGHPCITRF
jgi:hypothetical protein